MRSQIERVTFAARRLRSRWLQSGRPTAPSELRVLYAENTYPQLSESYVTAEVAFVRSLGVAVAVWSGREPNTPVDDDVPIFRGDLSDAIRRWSPHVVQVHSVHAAHKFRDAIRRNGLGMTVRGHWHYVPEQIEALVRDPSVLALYMYPHLLSRLEKHSSKILPMVASYASELYRPTDDKDRRLVVRTSAAKRSKGLDVFLRLAMKCPEHRFVLAVCTLGGGREWREVEALNRELGGAAEILTDLPYSEVAELVGRAGIYLHTYTDDPKIPFGMPVSIAEAMATGAFILCRRLPGASEYVGDAGALYESDEMAVQLIRSTEGWSDSEWELAARVSKARAHRLYRDDIVLQPMVDHWLRLLG